MIEASKSNNLFSSSLISSSPVFELIINLPIYFAKNFFLSQFTFAPFLRNITPHNTTPQPTNMINSLELFGKGNGTLSEIFQSCYSCTSGPKLPFLPAIDLGVFSASHISPEYLFLSNSRTEETGKVKNAKR